MDLSVFKIRGAGAFAVLLALTAGTATMQATQTLVVTPSTTVNLTCDGVSGPGAATTLTFKLGTAIATGTEAVSVSGAATGVTVTAVTSNTFTSGSGGTGATGGAGIQYTFQAASGCTGVTTGASTVIFTPAGGTATTINVNMIYNNAPNTITFTTNPSPATVTCSQVSGPGAAATITVFPVTAIASGTTTALTFTAPGSGLTVTPVGSTTFTHSNYLTGLQYTVNTSSGCAGASTGSTSISFSTANGTANTVSVSDTVTYVSQLSAAGVTVQCTYASTGSGTWTPGPAQTVYVYSPATGGTAYTVDSAVTTGAPWLTLSSLAGGTATNTASTFTVAATPAVTGSMPAPGCGGYALGTSHTYNLALDNAPAPAKLVPVTMQIVSASILTTSPATPTVTYQKGSGTPGYVDLLTTSSPTGVYVSVNTANLPPWLTVDSTTAAAPHTFRFSSTSVADTLAPGNYTATVYLKVSGYADTPVTISLQLNNKAAKLTVPPATGQTSGTVQNLTWSVGTALPTPIITAVSSDSPIAYTATTSGTLAPIVTPTTGLAYNFGTQIPVTFSPVTFASAQPGTTLTGTVTLTWGTPPSTVVVTFNIAIVSAAPTLLTAAPASVPISSFPNSYTVQLTGTGFVTGTDPTQKTTVGIIPSSSSTMVVDASISWTVPNPATINLTISVPSSADSNLPFTAGGNVVFGICNPNGGSCNAPQAQIVIPISSAPIIQAVTSASAFVEVNPGTNATTAAYDMLTVFGNSFCSSNNTGCTSTQVLYGVPDAATQRYPLFLSPDGVRNLTVNFYLHASPYTYIGTAPLLFATNSQMNLVVPAAVSTHTGNGTVDMVIDFGSVAMPATTRPTTLFTTSTLYTLNIAKTNPGVYTVGADGQGPAAVLQVPTYAQVTQANPAGLRVTAANSDTVSFYMTGLGVPDSTQTDTTGGHDTNKTDCIAATGSGSYEAALAAASGATLTNIDGAVIQQSIIDPSRLPPCMITNTGGLGGTTATIPAVKVGGVAASTVGYVGFVDSAVAGLYQVNVTLPSSGAALKDANGNTVNFNQSMQLPVSVEANGVYSQTGVSIWVAPMLTVAPDTGSLSCPVDTSWTSIPGANVVATEGGTPPYTYALTSGLLPAGLTLHTDGTITGTPQAGTGGTTQGQYVVTVTATDSSLIPVKGSATFTITVPAALYMSFTNGSNLSPGSVSSAPFANTATLTVSGGLAPYTMVLGTVTPPSGGHAGDITFNPSTGNISVASAAHSGTYTVTVTSTDSNATPLTGSITFTIVIGPPPALSMSLAGGSNVSPGAASGAPFANTATVNVSGGTGPYTMVLGTVTPPVGGAGGDITFDPSTGHVSVGSTPHTGVYTITVTSTDSNSQGPATGTITFTITLT